MGLGGFFKGLGKFALKAAPIATAFIPGIGPITSTLIGAATGAGSGAISGGGKGALIGGLMGAGTGALGGAAKSGKFGNFGKSALGKAVLGGTMPNGTQSGGLLQSLISGPTLQAAGQGLGAIAQTEAHNRGAKLSALMDADKMRMLNDQDRRVAEADIMRKLHQSEYIKSGGIDPSKPTVISNGHTLPKFDFGVHPSTDVEKQAASTLEAQLMDRLNNPAKLADYSKQMDPGAMENVLNWASPILTTIAAGKGVGNYQQPQAARTAQPGHVPTPTPYTFGQAMPTEAPPVVPGQLTQFGTTLDNQF